MRKFQFIARLLYMFLAGLSFFLLLLSRSGETYTVWHAMHPLFIPTFLFATFLLVTIIFSSERVEFKLVFIIVHSIISHSFFIIIFPAGNLGFQQSVLGITRRSYENLDFHGYQGNFEDVLWRIYNWIRGNNFQSVYSVMFARMFYVDVFWTHLVLIPLLWGTFIPIMAFMITKTLVGNETVSVLSSLLVSVFPTTIFWGAISVPNSLGYVFFLSFMYFCLKYLIHEGKNTPVLMAVFALASFLSHFLTGILSFSLLLLVVSFVKYEKEKVNSPLTAQFLLLISFILSFTLLPLALIYHKIFSRSYTYFSLAKLTALPITDLVWLLILGGYADLPLTLALIYAAGPLLGLAGMLYILLKSGKTNNELRVCTFFLFLGFLMAFLNYRILKFFMVNVPFGKERLWVFRDFMAFPFVAFAIHSVVTKSETNSRHSSSRKTRVLLAMSSNITKLSIKSLLLYVLTSILLTGWITASVSSAYPYFGPLQTTSYELEAVKYIHMQTNESYIVIGDVWIRLAGQMFAGIYNTHAFYFPIHDPRGTTLFIDMKTNPSVEIMIDAMKYNNASVAYFIAEKPRLGVEEFNRVVSQALENGLEVYKVFGEGKLYVFRYRNGTGA